MRKQKNQLNKNIFKILISVIIGVSLIALFLFLSSIIIVKYDVPFDKVSVFWIPIFIISGFVGGFVAGKLMKSRGIVWGSLTSGIMALIVCAVILLLNSFLVTPKFLIYLLFLILSGTVGGIIASNLK